MVWRLCRYRGPSWRALPAGLRRAVVLRILAAPDYLLSMLKACGLCLMWFRTARHAPVSTPRAQVGRDRVGDEDDAGGVLVGGVPAASPEIPPKT